MQTLDLKPSHAAVKKYYDALNQYESVIEPEAITPFCSRARAAMVKLESLIVAKNEGLLLQGKPLMICTTSARWIARELRGHVVGYFHQDNPSACIGSTNGGHDFTVVDNWIVDVWAHRYHGLPFLLDTRCSLDAVTIAALYGRTHNWEVVQF